MECAPNEHFAFWTHGGRRKPVRDGVSLKLKGSTNIFGRCPLFMSLFVLRLIGDPRRLRTNGPHGAAAQFSLTFWATNRVSNSSRFAVDCVPKEEFGRAELAQVFRTPQDPLRYARSSVCVGGSIEFRDFVLQPFFQCPKSSAQGLRIARSCVVPRKMNGCR